MEIEWIAMSNTHNLSLFQKKRREFLVNDDVIYDATQIFDALRTLPAFKFLVRLHWGEERYGAARSSSCFAIGNFASAASPA